MNVGLVHSLAVNIVKFGSLKGAFASRYIIYRLHPRTMMAMMSRRRRMNVEGGV